MTRWEERPIEVANLLNPAFCGHVIYGCAEAHETEAGKPMPYALAFFLPLVLHSDTRSTMKANTRHFEVWLNVNPEIKVGLVTRARSLVPFTREALGFLQRSGTLTIRETDAALVVSRSTPRSNGLSRSVCSTTRPMVMNALFALIIWKRRFPAHGPSTHLSHSSAKAWQRLNPTFATRSEFY
jgi:ABC-three component (ABC-3C) system Middle Component 3